MFKASKIEDEHIKISVSVSWWYCTADSDWHEENGDRDMGFTAIMEIWSPYLRYAPHPHMPPSCSNEVYFIRWHMKWGVFKSGQTNYIVFSYNLYRILHNKFYKMATLLSLPHCDLVTAVVKLPGNPLLSSPSYKMALSVFTKSCDGLLSLHQVTWRPSQSSPSYVTALSVFTKLRDGPLSLHQVTWRPSQSSPSYKTAFTVFT